jgi:hypothetical protein
MLGPPPYGFTGWAGAFFPCAAAEVGSAAERPAAASNTTSDRAKNEYGTETDFSENPMSHSKFVSFRLSRNECQTGSVFPVSK